MTERSATTTVERKPIGRTLVEQHLIAPHHVKEALEMQAKSGGKMVETLVRLGYLDPADFAKLIASQASYTSIEPNTYFLSDEFSTLLSAEFALKHSIFPLCCLDGTLALATGTPLDSATLNTIEETTLLPITPVLCAPDTVHDAIHQCYPSLAAQGGGARYGTAKRIEIGLTLQNIVNTLGTIETLPTLPETVTSILAAIHDHNSSLAEVASIIESDPPIAVRMLTLVNSAAYGVLNQIDDILHAVTLLGVRETYLTVLSAAVINLTETSKRFSYARYQESARFTAEAARSLSARCKLPHRAGVFTAGLLSDIGRFALSEVAPNPYIKINEDMPGTHLVAAEEDLLGIAHPEAGHILAVRWNLPRDIAEAIRFHHKPHLAQEAPKLVALVALASIMSEAHLRHTEPSAELFAEHGELLEILELTAADVAEVHLLTQTPEAVEIS